MKKVFSFIKKLFTHNRCDDCGFTQTYNQAENEEKIVENQGELKIENDKKIEKTENNIKTPKINLKIPTYEQEH